MGELSFVLADTLTWPNLIGRGVVAVLVGLALIYWRWRHD